MVRLAEYMVLSHETVCVVDITAITKCATESLARFNPEKICEQIMDVITQGIK